MADFRIVTLGDSVPWGQGLPEKKKFDTLVRDALVPRFPGGVSLERLAHSGAVIGAKGAHGHTAPDGEVPLSRLTIIEQCDGFANAPETVDLLLLDGGINDVGVATILNPLALLPPLSTMIRDACHDGMRVLLEKVCAKFTKSDCQILVLGYYVILSPQSNQIGISAMMSLHGIRAPSFVAEAEFAGPVVARCEQFAKESADHLQAAIREVGDRRVVFVPSGFTDMNAVFAPASLLWGLDRLLDPVDPVAAQRRPQCDLAFPPVDILHREQCYRASAGHPNVAGAVQYKNQILAALR
jgi:hypothetical protein